jgi:hypothetical protein
MISDEATRSEHELLIKCGIWPGSPDRSRSGMFDPYWPNGQTNVDFPSSLPFFLLYYLNSEHQ